MTYLIKKASGEIEEFSEKKLERSLRRAGASSELIKQITQQVKEVKPKSTKLLHEFTSKILEESERPIASRYNLKRALMELGPAGYPFERYIAALFNAQGYHAQTGQIVEGKCVDHEVDVILQKGTSHIMLECKFHNRSGIKSDVKVTLYVHARYLDILSAWKTDPNHHPHFHEVWLVTNTKFTTQAEQYAACENITLLSWNSGPKMSLAQMIDSLGLHPITTLSGLTKRQKREFVRENIVLCRDIGKHKKLLHQFGFNDQEVDQLVSEAEAVCTLPAWDE